MKRAAVGLFLGAHARKSPRVRWGESLGVVWEVALTDSRVQGSFLEGRLLMTILLGGAFSSGRNQYHFVFSSCCASGCESRVFSAFAVGQEYLSRARHPRFI